MRANKVIVSLSVVVILLASILSILALFQVNNVVAEASDYNPYQGKGKNLFNINGELNQMSNSVRWTKINENTIENNGSFSSGGINGQYITVYPNTYYTMSCEIRFPNLDENQTKEIRLWICEIEDINIESNWISKTKSIYPSNQFTKYSFTIKTDINTKFIIVRNAQNYGNLTYHIKNLQVEEGQTATAYEEGYQLNWQNSSITFHNMEPSADVSNLYGYKWYRDFTRFTPDGYNDSFSLTWIKESYSATQNSYLFPSTVFHVGEKYFSITALLSMGKVQINVYELKLLQYSNPETGESALMIRGQGNGLETAQTLYANENFTATPTQPLRFDILWQTDKATKSTLLKFYYQSQLLYTHTFTSYAPIHGAGFNQPISAIVGSQTVQVGTLPCLNGWKVTADSFNQADKDFITVSDINKNQSIIQESYNNGYEDGYNKGSHDLNVNVEGVISKSVGSIGSTIMEFLSIEIIPGISLWIILAALGGILIIGIVVKLVL